VLVDVLAREFPEDLSSEGLPDVFVLNEAPEVAFALFTEMLRGGFQLRIQAPPDAPAHLILPIVVAKVEELEKLMDDVRSHARDPLLYPFELWGIPSRNGRELGSGVDAFYALNRDPSLFMQALNGGAVRLTAFPSSLTLSVACSSLAMVEKWVKVATEASTLETRWGT